MQSLHIGTYAGIPVRIHWTFGLLIFYILYTAQSQGLDIANTIAFALFTMVIFLCVILHEYGHALTARKFGVGTLDIIISPIGGVARLHDIPKKPIQEFLVAITGPLVNVVLAVLLSAVTLVFYSFDEIVEHNGSFENLTHPLTFLVLSILLNGVLFLFNLIPAFPMDGGRILRALLSLKLQRVTATKIAMIIGQILGGLFILGTFYGESWTLGFIGLFVIITARREYQSVKLDHQLKSTTAREIMNASFTLLNPATSIGEVVNIQQTSSEKNFLIANESDSIIGILPKQHILKAHQAGNMDDSILDYVTSNFEVVNPEEKIIDLFHLMNNKGLSLVVVKVENKIVGTIDRDLLEQYLKKISS